MRVLGAVLGLSLLVLQAGCEENLGVDTNSALEAVPAKTVMLFDPQHGFQIVFFETAQKSWLWYPGNRESLSADVRQDSKQLCFKYRRNSNNPVTDKRGGGWSCLPRFLHEGLTVASEVGDVFNLAGGHAPYIRGKCDGTQRFGRGTVDPGLYRQGCQGN
ncbi:hypothetical protein ACFP4H_20775 [Pseudophaeobacter arcticus]|uniref:hypothetical protein n=1 Tax=Pseudophaeobacter arcticus TaxID=385492 RepID=UPI0012B62145|nr:hypothetical protein [Pseudophaeobacter arcticus]